MPHIKNYENQLDFVKQLLSRMMIHTHVAASPKTSIAVDIDLGLRAMLFELDDYASFSRNSMEDAKPNTIYCYFDEYDCKYIFFPLPENNRFFFIGPYLFSVPDETAIRKKMERQGISETKYHMIYKYYTTLPIIDNEEFLLTIVNTLADTIWGKNNYHLEYLQYMITDRHERLPYIRQQETNIEDSPQSLALIERIYDNENRMMHAVAEGKLHKISTISSYLTGNSIESRVTDTLRNRKNYLIILKTLLRKAAENGNVHPIHIDRESSLYAHKIESARSIRECDKLQQAMIKDFCLLVKRHSLNRYSSLVGKAVTIISFDLTADLRLATLAKQLNVHPNYLSSQFRKECGCTLTDYVNQKRMEQAILLLKKSDKQVQTIASECGIHDTNYFIKLFKRYTGFTPSEYRKEY